MKHGTYRNGAQGETERPDVEEVEGEEVRVEKSSPDAVSVLTQALSTLPGHLTTAGIILYIMLVFLPERDAQHAAILLKQEETWSQTVKAQRLELLESQKQMAVNYEERLKTLRDMYLTATTENNRLLQEILARMKGKRSGEPGSGGEN